VSALSLSSPSTSSSASRNALISSQEFMMLAQINAGNVPPSTGPPL
jgi:hypothetical protein